MFKMFDKNVLNFIIWFHYLSILVLVFRNDQKIILQTLSWPNLIPKHIFFSIMFQYKSINLVTRKNISR